MIKKIKHPDGTEEIIEGTAEEFARLERERSAQPLRPQDESTEKKPRVLRDVLMPRGALIA